jgi:hypothetical protein
VDRRREQALARFDRWSLSAIAIFQQLSLFHGEVFYLVPELELGVGRHS